MKLIREWPAFFIILVWLVFALPYFIFSKTPYPSSYQVNFFAPWNAYSEFSSPYKNGAMPDVIGQLYPWKKFTIETYKKGEIPFWNPYSFSGTPHAANNQSAVFSPVNIIFFILPFESAWVLAILLQPLFAGIFTYLFTRSLNFSRVSQAISSISFMFCGFIVTWMAYGTLSYAISFLPLALFSIYKYFEHAQTKYLLILLLSIFLSLVSGHFQTSVFFLIFTLAYILFNLLQTKKINKAIFLIATFLFGIALSSPQLFITMVIYAQSFRSSIFIKTEIIPWGYLPTLIAPDFFGNPVTRNDWFGHYAEWNAYAGIIPFFLAIYSFVKIKKPFVLFFVSAGIISLLIAFGTPLQDLIVALKIPVLSTSAASRAIVVFSFCISILAGFGFDQIARDIKKNRLKVVVWLIFSTLLIAFLWGIVLFKLFIPQDKIGVALSNLRFPTLIFIFGMFSIFALLTRSKRIIAVSSLLLILITSFDMLRFTTKWMPIDNIKLAYPKTGITEFAKKIAGYERVYGGYGAEGSVYFGLPSVEGYDAVYIRRYGQFVSSIQDGKLNDAFRSVVAYPKNGKYSLLGANFLGIKYFVHKISDGQNVWEFPFWSYSPGTVNKIFDDGAYRVLENTNVFPRAFLVQEVIVEKDSQKILNRLFNSDIRNTAVIEEGKSEKVSSGSAKVISYSANNIVIETESKGKSFLVLTDSFDPGWKVNIDGKETKLYRTDYSFRGLKISPGKHEVSFHYLPKSFVYGILAAIIGVMGFITIIIFSKRVIKD